MGTKQNPGQFDCYAGAEPDEPIFVLRGKDPSAPLLIETWAMLRDLMKDDPIMIAEARDCAHDCYQWMLKLGRHERWRAFADAWFEAIDRIPEGARIDFDLTIGQLDRIMSKMIDWAKQSRDDADRQTLKHHAEDMIMAGEKILSLLAPTYTCDHCGVAAPKDQWGAGRITCPACKKVALSAAERAKTERAA